MRAGGVGGGEVNGVASERGVKELYGPRWRVRVGGALVEPTLRIRLSSEVRCISAGVYAGMRASSCMKLDG